MVDVLPGGSRQFLNARAEQREMSKPGSLLERTFGVHWLHDIEHFRETSSVLVENPLPVPVNGVAADKEFRRAEHLVGAGNKAWRLRPPTTREFWRRSAFAGPLSSSDSLQYDTLGGAGYSSYLKPYIDRLQA